METVTRFESRRAEQLVETTAPPQTDAARMLAVTASYLLSEDGRKASLLSGGNGRALQELVIQVPANRLHLVAVDAQGRARLKLRPRFELNGDQRVVRIDAPPTYDTPPSIEDLFREAGRNHQLEHAFHAEHSAARHVEREADRQRRGEVAEAFLKEPQQRPLRRPTPNPQRCHLDTKYGRLVFDVRSDEGDARLVPPEAYKRFRADLRARSEAKQRETAAQIASHEEKKRAIADWIAEFGTPQQQARHAAGVLPMQEVLEAMADQAFAAGDSFERYPFDGAARLQQRLRQLPQHAQVAVNPTDLKIFGTDAVTATEAQWMLVQRLQAAFADATVTLRQHRIAWKGDSEAPTLTMYGVIVTLKVGPFDLRREYAAPEA
jgi:hypothetical protein